MSDKAGGKDTRTGYGNIVLDWNGIDVLGKSKMELNEEENRIFQQMRYAEHPRLIDLPWIKGKLRLVSDGGGWRVTYDEPILKGSPFTSPWFTKEYKPKEVMASQDVQETR